MFTVMSHYLSFCKCCQHGAVQKVDTEGLVCISLDFLVPEAPNDGKLQVETKLASVCTDTCEFGFNFPFPTFGALGVTKDETMMLEESLGGNGGLVWESTTYRTCCCPSLHGAFLSV